ncbi:hypothetical protein GIB67_027702 [Kingdonia uniflora]|uniref:superoxide dismutase n=1 Tax=Kingdonia uniflora TaxID=39325 RepID=A0A7J7NLQ7_9MAGN|nr:hypothetical protein GIB67_027702 [Kingdonia uniflora]
MIDDNGPTTVNVKITGLAPGPHGIHLHEFGDTTNGFISTVCMVIWLFVSEDLLHPPTHGVPEDEVRHAGDLGNIIANVDVAEATIIPLSRSNAVIGRALVHELQDDLRKEGHELSLSTGNDGGRLACGYCPNPLSDLPSQEVAFGINYNHNNSVFHVPYNFSSMNRPYMNDALFYSHQNPMDFDHLAQSLVPLPSQNQMHHSLPIFNRSQEAATNAWASQYPSAMRNMRNLKAFTCEDGLIMQGENMNYVTKNRLDHSNGHSRGSLTGTWIGRLNETTQIDGLNNPNVHSPLFLPLTYNRLSDYEGSIYHLARDQNGCRFLQRKFKEETQ